MDKEQMAHYQAVCKENEILKRRVVFLCSELGEAGIYFNGKPRSSLEWAVVSMDKAEKE